MEEKMEFNYIEDLNINLEELHNEWLKQSVLYMQYAEEAAKASRAKDTAKNKLEVIKAQLDLEIRGDPAKFELAKVTETAVANVILIQGIYQEALREYQQTKYNSDILTAAVRAFDQRKTALENEVRLWIGAYYSEPKESDDATRGFKERSTKEASIEQRENLHTKKKEKW
jgi:hypothetical protein